jgi:hypothetical protein
VTPAPRSASPHCSSPSLPPSLPSSLFPSGNLEGAKQWPIKLKSAEAGASLALPLSPPPSRPPSLLLSFSCPLIHCYSMILFPFLYFLSSHPTSSSVISFTLPSLFTFLPLPLYLSPSSLPPASQRPPLHPPPLPPSLSPSLPLSLPPSPSQNRALSMPLTFMGPLSTSTAT